MTTSDILDDIASSRVGRGGRLVLTMTDRRVVVISTHAVDRMKDMSVPLDEVLTILLDPQEMQAGNWKHDNGAMLYMRRDHRITVCAVEQGNVTTVLTLLHFTRAKYNRPGEKHKPPQWSNRV